MALFGRKSLRQFACNDTLWATFERMAGDQEKNVDELVNDALEAYARSMVAGWYHPVGTCRMGPTLEGGSVVDDHLRVHGVEGLRVVDASIMPRITKAPTNLTAIAIGERAADLIRSE